MLTNDRRALRLTDCDRCGAPIRRLPAIKVSEGVFLCSALCALALAQEILDDALAMDDQARVLGEYETLAASLRGVAGLVG